MQQEMNVLALVKNSERYVFLYDDDSTEAVLQKLGQYAADKDLSFSWWRLRYGRSNLLNQICIKGYGNSSEKHIACVKDYAG